MNPSVKFLVDFIKSNKYILLSLFVLLVYLSPNIFFPHQARYLIHDNLDSNVVWYKNLAESGKMFLGNYENIPNSLGGIPRGCYPAQYNLLYLFYLWFSPLFAYNLNIVLMHIVAFFSMYIFTKRYIFKGSYNELAIGVSLCFALIPFWPSGELSIPGQPLLLFAFLNILNKEYKLTNWLIIVLFPFYSVLVFSSLFFCVALFFGFVIYSLIKKQINYYFILAFILFIGVSVIADYRLFTMQFVDHFESHRSSLANPGTLNFKGLIGVSFLHFLKGQYHFPSLQFPFILLISISAIFLAKEKKQKLRVIGLLLTAYFISFLYVLPDWTALQNLMAKSVLIKSISFRFYSLFPILWLIILAYSSYIVAKHHVIGKKIVPFIYILIAVSAFFSVNSKDYQNSDFTENSFFNTFVKKNKGTQASFDEYYKTSLFGSLKKQVQPGAYFIGCIGFAPEIAQFNGFNTIDGYFFYYPKKYNELMNEITAKERAKTNEPLLASRCYLVSNDEVKGKKEITDLAFDFDKMMLLGTRYIFSTKKIINEHLSNEIIIHSDISNENIFIYNLKKV